MCVSCPIADPSPKSFQNHENIDLVVYSFLCFVDSKIKIAKAYKSSPQFTQKDSSRIAHAAGQSPQDPRWALHTHCITAGGTWNINGEEYALEACMTNPTVRRPVLPTCETSILGTATRLTLFKANTKVAAVVVTWRKINIVVVSRLRVLHVGETGQRKDGRYGHCVTS